MNLDPGMAFAAAPDRPARSSMIAQHGPYHVRDLNWREKVTIVLETEMYNSMRGGKSDYSLAALRKIIDAGAKLAKKVGGLVEASMEL